MKRFISLAIGTLAFAFLSTASQAAITSLTITDATLSKSTGLTTVTGTIVCTATHTVEVLSFVAQITKSRISQTNLGTGLITCSGGTDTWTATQVFSLGLPIKPGSAFADAMAADLTDVTFASTSKSVSVHPVP